jgi:hypothetical protein
VTYVVTLHHGQPTNIQPRLEPNNCCKRSTKLLLSANGNWLQVQWHTRCLGDGASHAIMEFTAQVGDERSTCVHVLDVKAPHLNRHKICQQVLGAVNAPFAHAAPYDLECPYLCNRSTLLPLQSLDDAQHLSIAGPK